MSDVLEMGVRNSKVRKSTCEHTHMHIHLQRVVDQLGGGWGSVGGGGGGRGSEI